MILFPIVLFPLLLVRSTALNISRTKDERHEAKYYWLIVA